MKLNDFDNIILIAKGALTYLPYFEEHFDNLNICWYSRFTYPKDMQWITAAPEPGAKILLFDRSITTGISVYKVKVWLESLDYEVYTLGVIDPLSRFGIHFLDFVLHEKTIITREEFSSKYDNRISGYYSFISYRDEKLFSESPFNAIPKLILNEISPDISFRQIEKIAQPYKEKSDVLVICNNSWDLGKLLVLTHIMRKPLIRLGDTKDCDISLLKAQDILKGLPEYA